MMMARGVWRLAMMAGAITTGATVSVSAQRAAIPAVSALDAWLVSRFHGAQLLTDSAPTSASEAA